MDVKTYHREFYGPRLLGMDETGNDFTKVAPVWPDSRDSLRILDIGCGGGSVSSALEKRGHAIYGLDILQEAVRRARQKGVRALLSDLNWGLPFISGSFDAVLALDILEHLFDPLEALREIRRVLRDDGFAIIMVPLSFDLRQRVKILCGGGIVSYEHVHYASDLRPWNYFHIRFFTLAEIWGLIQEAGFRIEACAYRSVPPIALGPLAGFYWWPLMACLARSFPSLLSSGVACRVVKAEPESV